MEQWEGELLRLWQREALVVHYHFNHKHNYPTHMQSVKWSVCTSFVMVVTAVVITEIAWSEELVLAISTVKAQIAKLKFRQYQNTAI